MAEESGDQHEEEAYDDAGGEWEVEGKVVAFNQKITGQTSDVRDPWKELEGDPQYHNKNPGANQPSSQGLDSHGGIIRNLKQRF